MARTARNRGADRHARPHRLAVYWTWTDEGGGARGCEMMVPAGVLRLNATAAAIWELLDGRRDLAAVAAALARLYPGAGPGELADAVDQLLAQLEAVGAVVRQWSPLDPCPALRATRPSAEPGA